MDNLFQKLMLGGSTAALVAVASLGGAKAQDTGDIEQVVVSASRITIAGYTAPTPVTVVGAAQLESEANINIGDTIRQLPSLGTSEGLDNGSKAGDAAQGDAGVDSVALRNLGTTRTLVLFDGQRVVTSNPLGGGVDLSTIPTALISRVDVVTGGASAAWGSDAVGGGGNLILNKNFDGFKANAEVGQNKTNNHQEYRADASFGTDIFGGRGHVVLSMDYTMSPDMMTNTTTNWYRNQTLVPSATLYPGVPGLPTNVHTYGLTAGSAQYTQGGLITASAAGAAGNGNTSPLAAANSLKGIQFTTSAANPVPFNFGQATFDGQCVNCSANELTNTTQIGTIATPYHSTTLFGYARYKLTDTIQASVQLNYGTTFEENDDSDRTSNNVIASGNPFIPATVQARMVAGGITSITVSTNNLGNTNVKNPTTMDFAANSIGMGINYANRQLMRGVFTLEGELGNDWSWNAYIQHSQVREVQKDPQGRPGLELPERGQCGHCQHGQCRHLGPADRQHPVPVDIDQSHQWLPAAELLRHRQRHRGGAAIYPARPQQSGRIEQRSLQDVPGRCGRFDAGHAALGTAGGQGRRRVRRRIPSRTTAQPGRLPGHRRPGPVEQRQLQFFLRPV